MTSKLLPFRLLTHRLKTLTLMPNHNLSTIRSSSSRARRKEGFLEAREAGSGHGKSLIEDEAELSDWVSDLKTDSLRFSLNGSDDDEFDKKKQTLKRNDRDNRNFKKNDRDFSGTFDRDSRENGVSDKRNFKKNDRDSSGSFDRRKPDGSFHGARRDNRENGFPERKTRGSSVNSRYGSDLADESNKFDKRKSNNNFKSYERNSDGMRKKGSENWFPERKSSGSVSKNRYVSDSEEDDEGDEKEEFLSRQRRSSNNFIETGGGLESSYKQGRKSILEMSDEDEVDVGSDDDELYGFDDNFFGKKEIEKVGKNDPLLKSGSLNELGHDDSQKTVLRCSSGGKDSYLSNTRFDECSISSLSLKGIKAAGYERMTLVQEATLPVILKGKDVLAKAKTGTGKTVAFLLPAIEIVSKLPPVDRDQKRPPINVLVICPTRELADQAATEANTLLKFHPSIGVQCVIGGTRLALEQNRMQTNPCQILVATPGRLRDHIENTPGFAARLMGIKVLVLDEADRLLDMGFRKDIEKIVAAVPKQRQTLLFSATVPDEVRQICYIAMKRDHEFVNTVVEGSEETHSQVEQMHLIAPLEKQLPILYGLLKDHIAEDVDYKVIVFCTTAMVTKLVADLLSELRLNVREIHSRKPQSYRTRVSKEFKESKGLILVSSDVSARGVDYPDVTLVVQVGVPADREQYIHRLGRTGRKGKEGKGVLLLAPWEEFFLSNIKDLPMKKAPLPLIDPDTTIKVERSLGHVEMKNKESAYQAWLGYYNSNKTVGRDKYKLVLLANEFSRSLGLDNPPALPQIVVRKMGLSNVPGLRAK